MRSVLKRSNFSDGNIFQKFVLTSVKKFDELNEKKSLSMLPPNILPIEHEMLKVLENSTLSTAQRLSFYKNLLFSNFSSKSSSESLRAANRRKNEEKSFLFSPWINASKINRTQNSSIAGNELLDLDQNILKNANEDSENEIESMMIANDDDTLKPTLMPSTSTPSSRLIRRRRTASSLRKRLLSAKDDTIGKRMRTKLIFDDNTDEDDDEENGDELFHEARDDETDKTEEDGGEMFASIVETPITHQKITSDAATEKTVKTPSKEKNRAVSNDDIYLNDSMEFDRSLERQKILKDIAEASANKKNLDFRKLQYRYLEDPRKDYFNVRNPLTNEIMTIDKSSPLKRHQNKIRELQRQQQQSKVTPPTTRAKESAKAVNWITFEEAFKHT